MPFFDCTMLGGLSAMGFDVAEVQFGLPDDRVLREGVQARDVGDVLRAEFTGQDASALQLVLPRLDGDVTPYALSLSRLEGVARVATTDGVYAGGAQGAACRCRHRRVGLGRDRRLAHRRPVPGHQQPRRRKARTPSTRPRSTRAGARDG